jgi:RND family efflux transporter MFP subunit
MNRTLPGIVLAALALAAAPQSRPALELDGMLEPYEVVTLGPSVDGVLAEVFVDRGDLVEAGQPVARLESSVEELQVRLAELRAKSGAAVEAAQARLAFTRAARERNEVLFEDNLVSMEELDQVRANESIALADLTNAQENQEMARLDYERNKAALALRTIRSPITGIVTERFRSPGELVSRVTQMEIVQVAQIDPLRVEIIAPVGMLGVVRVGMEAIVLPETPADQGATGRVTVVDQVVDAASATFRIRLEVPNPGHLLVAGVRCRVRLVE